MEEKGFDQIDVLLEKLFWVVDPLPYQVPAEGEGQFFAVEKFFLESPMRCLLLQKHARILLKINCYYDIWVAEGENERWIRNPDPAFVYRLATEERGGSLCLLPAWCQKQACGASAFKDRI